MRPRRHVNLRILDLRRGGNLHGTGCGCIIHFGNGPLVGFTATGECLRSHISDTGRGRWYGWRVVHICAAEHNLFGSRMCYKIQEIHAR